jgi:uncharacterized phiE125 gp8 family phage protein
MWLRLITAPTEEPIDTATAASEARLTTATEIDRMDRYRVPARRAIEDLTGRALLDQTWELVLPGFPCGAIEIPRPPLIAITSVTYYDTANAAQTLAVTTGYVLEGPSTGNKTEAPMPARLHQPSGVSWPSTYDTPEAVVIRFRAGYGTLATDVPQMLRLAVARMAAQLYEGMVDQEAILALVAPYRVWTFA